MPVRRGKDSKGCFYQWGSQKKYHYRCGDEKARKRAKKNAERQGSAIRSSGYSE